MDESALHSGGMIITLDSPPRQRRQAISSPTAAPGAVASDTQTVNSKQLRKWLAPLALGVLLLLIPAPSGLPHAAWRYFALFAAVIESLITEPLPGAAIGFFGVTIAAGLLLLGKTPGGEATKWALSGFSNDAVWLIFAAAMFALGYEATGLGRRIALLLVNSLGRRTPRPRLRHSALRSVSCSGDDVQHGAQRWHGLSDRQEHPAAVTLVSR